MRKIKLIEERKSTRDYQNKEVKRGNIKNIEDFILSYTQNDYSDIELVLEKDGNDIYQKLNGISGYNGIMVKAPHYIVIYTKKEDVEYRKAGFVGEKLIISMLGEDVDSCWIDVNDSEAAKKALGVTTDKDIVALIAFGYSTERTFINKMFKNTKGSAADVKRKGYRNNDFDVTESDANRQEATEYLFLGTWGEHITSDELARRGLDNVYRYIQYAPSHGNRQPWKFIICPNEMVITVEKSDDIVDRSENLEGGIAMFYLYVAMNEAGYAGDWNYSDNENKYEVPQDYRIIGKFVVRR